MLRAIMRWTPGILALFAVGPIAGALTAAAHARDGGPEATALVAANPVIGLAGLLAAVFLAALLAIPTARFVDYRIATWTASFVLAWAAWRQASVDELIRVARPHSPMIALALEGLLAGGLGVAIILALNMAAAQRAEHGASTAPPPAASPASRLAAALRGESSWAGVALAAAVTAVLTAGVCALLVLEPLKGQAIFGVAVGSFAGAAAGTWASTLLGPATRDTPCFLGIAIAATLTPILAHFMLGDRLLAASFAGTFPGFAAPIGLDWIAGGLMGVPGGVAAAGHLSNKPAPASA